MTLLFLLAAALALLALAVAVPSLLLGRLARFIADTLTNGPDQ